MPFLESEVDIHLIDLVQKMKPYQFAGLEKKLFSFMVKRFSAGMNNSECF